MTASLSRLVPRRNSDNAMPIRTSDHVRSDIAASEQEAQDAIAEGLRLNSQTRAILLSGDDGAHERHETDMARLRRIVARCEARQEELGAELQAIEAREVEEAKGDLRAQAEAAVAAVLAKVGEGYTKPAETIAAFLAEWIEAERLAREAGVAGPDAAHRHRPGEGEPAYEEPFTAYVDENGNATQNPHPYRNDGMIDRTRERERQTFYRTVPAKVSCYPTSLPKLSSTVNLPRYADQGEHHRAEKPVANRWS
ncbi:hypothetical protein [uncultured Methylobacterium sp.]|uniref:hypothetical protein n=1 Tax=uncultured Methylobacterium sp. TaxID=157278 RepID=UPI0035CA85E5